MWTQLKTAAVAGIVGAAAATGTVALAGSGVGGIFNLGKANTVNATSDLYGSTNGPQLRVTNVSPGANPAIRGYSKNAEGVIGTHTSTTGRAAGVEGDTSSGGGSGVLGKAPLAAGPSSFGEAGVNGVLGEPSSWSASYPAGVHGDSKWEEGVGGTSDKSSGVAGTSSDGFGVYGASQNLDGVSGYSAAANGIGVLGQGHTGVAGTSTDFEGVRGVSMHNAGIYGSTTDGFAGYFDGPVEHHGDVNVYGSKLNVNDGRARVTYGGTGAHSDTSAALQAENETTGGEAAWFRQGNSGNSTAVVALIKQASGSGDFLDCYTQSGGFSHVACSINNAGTFVSGSDFAESLPAVGGRAGYGVGDVVVASRAHPGSVELSRRASDRGVIGVYSARPGVLGAAKRDGTHVARDEISVAIAGIVPVRASAENGAIRPGDLLVTAAAPGRVMRAGASPRTGTVVGKALGSLMHGRGLVRALVMQR